MSQASLSDEQVANALDAALEVLNGATPGRILERLEELVVAKNLLAGVTAGELVLRRLPSGPASETAAALPG